MLDIFYYSLIHWLYRWCHVGGKIYNLNIAHEWNFFMNSAIVNKLIVIKAFLFALYSIGFDFMVLKHLSLADLPIVSKGNFSVPSILTPTEFKFCPVYTCGTNRFCLHWKCLLLQSPLSFEEHCPSKLLQLLALLQHTDLNVILFLSLNPFSKPVLALKPLFPKPEKNFSVFIWSRGYKIGMFRACLNHLSINMIWFSASFSVLALSTHCSVFFPYFFKK